MTYGKKGMGLTGVRGVKHVPAVPSKIKTVSAPKQGSVSRIGNLGDYAHPKRGKKK